MRKVKNNIRQFLSSEDGIGAVEKVAMLAVAAIILVGMLKFTNSVLMVKTKENVETAMEFKIDGSGGGADVSAERVN